MPGHHPKQPPAPQPTRMFFDPFNSSSTGHQRAENRLSGSTSWRESRTYKLSHQFKDASGRGGDRHLADLVGAGSENFGLDGRKANGDWEEGSQQGLRETGWQDIRDLMGGCKKRLSERGGEDGEPGKKRLRAGQGQSHDGPRHQHRHKGETGESCRSSIRRQQDKAALLADNRNNPNTDHTTTTGTAGADAGSSSSQPPQIFRNLTIYLNGSSFPVVSDHKLKHLVAQHGGNASISLGRRTVTHVVLGTSAAGGGGLAGGKIQKEVRLVHGKGVKYVTAQWVVDSVARGVRQPESRYVPDGVGGRIGGSGQVSVRQMFQLSGWAAIAE
ncbi:BRCT domain-containing protein [Fonsecaea pedrosoi]|nr:BRCT domain-containing protein [Fonsecaea pedrosoi]